MMIHAVLGNPNHPEYGVATIPFPIPHDQYAHCMELLEALEIGDAVKADCQVQEINSFYSVLKHTEKLTVNVEELNYLARRLDGFDMGEATWTCCSSKNPSTISSVTRREVYVFTSAATSGICSKSTPHRIRKHCSAQQVEDNEHCTCKARAHGRRQ